MLLLKSQTELILRMSDISLKDNRNPAVSLKGCSQIYNDINIKSKRVTVQWNGYEIECWASIELDEKTSQDTAEMVVWDIIQK